MSAGDNWSAYNTGLAAGNPNQFVITTGGTTGGTLTTTGGTLTTTGLYANTPGTWTTYSAPADYKEPFEKLISYVLGGKLPQETKDVFVNEGMRLQEFRQFVAEYFPQYAEKIKLWEKLHNEPSK